MLENLFIV